MNPKLQDAVAVFKALGWEEATPETVMQLPVGTAQQKRTRSPGCEAGSWAMWGISGGIPSAGTALWMWMRHAGPVCHSGWCGRAESRGAFARHISKAVVDVLTARGAKYASDFIGYACVSSRRMYEYSASAFGSIAVHLVNRLDLDIPQSVEYIKDRAVYAAVAMGLEAETRYQEINLPGVDLMAHRFAEHIYTGLAVGAPASGPFGAVLPAAVQRGRLSRDKAVELVFSTLDAAVRPGDRKVWLGVLDELEGSDQEFTRRIQALIPLLALGKSAVIQQLAPVLIAQADEDLLVEVLLAAFSATSKKTK